MPEDPTPKQDIERLTQGLARLARALVEGERGLAAGTADRLVADALRDAGAADSRKALVRRLLDLNRARRRGDAAGSARRSPSGIAHMMFNAGEALCELKLECREALALVVVEGFGYADAAGILGVSRDIVMTRVAEGRRGLDEYMQATAGAASPVAASPGAARPPWLRVVK